VEIALASGDLQEPKDSAPFFICIGRYNLALRGKITKWLREMIVSKIFTNLFASMTT